MGVVNISRVVSEPTLEDFEVLEVGVFGVDIELDSPHGQVL